MYRTTVRLGTMAIAVEGATLQAMLQEARYVEELDQAREGEEATPFFREWDGFRYYGFRRADGAEVMFGQHKDPKSPARVLFAYGRTSEGYRGWQRYDAERGERIRIESQPAPAQPAATGGKASARQRERIRDLLARPCIRDDERADVQRFLDDRRLTAEKAAQLVAALEQRVERRSPSDHGEDLPF